MGWVCSFNLRFRFETPSAGQVHGLLKEDVEMSKLLWLFVGVAIAIWSGLAWIAYGVVGWGGQVASSNADIVTAHPETVEWLSWLAMFGSGVGEWLVIGLWALGTLIALAIGFVGTRLFPKLSGLSDRLRSQQ
jgi:hypothetical protein